MEWDETSLIPSGENNNLKVNIILHEARAFYDNRIEWTNHVQVANGVNNSGTAQFRLPRRADLPLLRGASAGGAPAYSIVLFQVSIDLSSTSNSNNPYYDALRQLRDSTANTIEAGIWSHVLFRKLKRETNEVSCSKWSESAANHPTSFEGVDACPCTLQQANLPMSTFAPRTTPGKQKLDRFFHGRSSVCYEPKRPITLAIVFH